MKSKIHYNKLIQKSFMKGIRTFQFKFLIYFSEFISINYFFSSFFIFYLFNCIV